MTNSRLLLPILAAALFCGASHAGEFSLGGARLLAENSTQAAVDINVTFTDRGRSSSEAGEGGDAATVQNARTLRGADAATPDASDDHTAVKTPAPKPAEPATSGTDAPHGSILPPSAIKRPSYRWQSLVPGTIK